MNGFGFTESQEMFRREMRAFAQRELAPGIKDRIHLDYMPPEIIKKIASLGLLGMGLPEKYGGEPVDSVALMTGLAIEEMTKVDFIAGMLPAHIGRNVLNLASEEVKEEWLPPLISGDKLICLGLTEPDCGSDAAAIKAKAVKDGDYYVLSGEKTSITMGMQAEVFITYAKTDPSAGARGVSCFAIPLDLPGISRSRYQDMGWAPAGRSSITLDEVRLPAKYMIGEEGKGFYIIMNQFDYVRVHLGLAALGAAQSSLGEAMEYAKQRTAFGRPIGKFEGTSFKIAEHATLIDAARLLSYRALWLRDQGLPHTKEAAMCKWFCPKVAVNAIHDSLLIHGHVGYSEEYPIEQRLRDVIGLEIADGTAEIMKMIIVRELLGADFLPY